MVLGNINPNLYLFVPTAPYILYENYYSDVLLVHFVAVVAKSK